jgi:hypothetical protein
LDWPEKGVLGVEVEWLNINLIIMKKLLFIFVMFISYFAFSQDKINKRWYSTIDLEFINPQHVIYDYHYVDNPGYHDDEIANTKAGFGMLYSINYNIFKKLSLGAITGIQYMNSPDYNMLKLGGSIKYFFVDNNNVYTYINIANDFSLNKDQFKNGGDFRIGIGFPVFKRQKFNINTNVFWESQLLRLNGSVPLFYNEIPGSTDIKSFGLSVGVKF